MPSIFTAEHLRLCMFENERDKNFCIGWQTVGFNVSVHRSIFTFQCRYSNWDLGKRARFFEDLIRPSSVISAELKTSINYHLRSIWASQAQPFCVNVLPHSELMR